MATVQLSSLSLAGFALKAIPRRLNLFIGLCAPSLLILLATAFIARMAVPEAATAEPEAVAAEIEAALQYIGIATLPALVALVPAFTAWHRLIATGEPRNADGKLYAWGRPEWRYLNRLVMIWLCTIAVNFVVSIAMATLAGSAGGQLIAAFAVIGAQLVIWSNMGMALPAAALDRPSGFGDGLRLVAGNAGKVALALAMTWALLGMVGVVVGTIIGVLGSQFLVLVSVILFSYMALLGSVGVLSRAYGLLSQPGA